MSAKAKAAIAAAAVALGIWIATGVMPPPGQGATAYTSQARGPCEAARALNADAGVLDCEPGEMVYVTVESFVDADGGTGGGSLPDGFEALPGSLKDEHTPRRSDRALTVLGNHEPDRCLGGQVRRDTSEAQDGSRYWTPKRGWGVCCGDRCSCAGPSCAAVCPPHVFAGDNCSAIICRNWPGLEGCN